MTQSTAAAAAVAAEEAVPRTNVNYAPVQEGLLGQLCIEARQWHDCIAGTAAPDMRKWALHGIHSHIDRARSFTHTANAPLSSTLADVAHAFVDEIDRRNAICVDAKRSFRLHYDHVNHALVVEWSRDISTRRWPCVRVTIARLKQRTRATRDAARVLVERVHYNAIDTFSVRRARERQDASSSTTSPTTEEMLVAPVGHADGTYLVRLNTVRTLAALVHNELKATVPHGRKHYLATMDFTNESQRHALLDSMFRHEHLTSDTTDAIVAALPPPLTRLKMALPKHIYRQLIDERDTTRQWQVVVLDTALEQHALTAAQHTALLWLYAHNVSLPVAINYWAIQKHADTSPPPAALVASAAALPITTAVPEKQTQ